VKGEQCNQANNNDVTWTHVFQIPFSTHTHGKAKGKGQEGKGYLKALPFLALQAAGILNRCVHICFTTRIKQMDKTQL
jgi:hypothetical protein